MLVLPNYVYNFTFVTALESLNGIYKVESLLSYAEVIGQGLDIFALTYQPNGLDEAAFKTDLAAIRLGKIAKLVSVTDATKTLYIPEKLFSKIPEINVQKYLTMGLAVNLGIIDDAELLGVVKTEVEQVVQSMLGKSAQAVVYTVKENWLTQAEFKVIDDARKASITRVSNHYVDKQKLIKEIDSLKTLLAHYEQLLISTTP
jgi:hypothetical protein